VQLVQLQNAKQRFEKQGLKLVAISYDTPEILKYFADRQKIDFPLLADPDSKTIRAYGVLNTEATGMQRGMALPGYFFIDTRGVIREKFFESKYQERFSPNNVIGKLFPELSEEVTSKVEAPHLQLSTAQSDTIGFPGSRVTLSASVRLPADVHVYAPGVTGYKPIELAITNSPEVEVTPAAYPHSKILYLPAIKERVPVFEGTFQITQDVTVTSAAQFSNSLGTAGKALTLKGELKYQACDKKICYLPASVPLEWHLQIFPLDRQRAPEAIQHK